MKAGSQEGYQEVVAADTERTRQRLDGTEELGKLDQLSTDEQNHGTPKTSGFDSSANNQHSTANESIIYLGTLDLSLRFLGR